MHGRSVKVGTLRDARAGRFNRVGSVEQEEVADSHSGMPPS